MDFIYPLLISAVVLLLALSGGQLLFFWQSRKRVNPEAEIQRLRLAADKQREELANAFWEQAQQEFDKMRQRLDAEGKRMEAESRLRRDMEEILALWSVGIGLLLAQVKSLNAEPAWEPSPDTLKWVQQRLERVQQRRPPMGLVTLLDQHFNDEELSLLAYDLGVDYDNLPGDMKQKRARELVAWMRRYGREKDLIQALRGARPSVEWASIVCQEGGC